MNDMLSPWEKKATHASIEATPGPTFGGGYRVTIFKGKKPIASSHFPCPESHRTWKLVLKGGDTAYANAKRYAAGFGCC